MMGGIARRPIIGRRGRRSNKVTLAVALSQVLKDKTMRVTDAADAVRAAGYKTGSRSSRVQVNIARIKNPKLFRRAGRGLCMAN
jgi:predicted TIM-barrel enzyme